MSQILNLDDLKDEYLVCDVCGDEYGEEPQEPRVLPCLHTFCTKCLEGMVRDWTIICPTCRIKHTVPGDRYAAILLKSNHSRYKKSSVHCVSNSYTSGCVHPVHSLSAIHDSQKHVWTYNKISESLHMINQLLTDCMCNIRSIRYTFKHILFTASRISQGSIPDEVFAILSALNAKLITFHVETVLTPE